MSETPSKGCLVKLKCLKTEMDIKGKAYPAKVCPQRTWPEKEPT